MQTTVPIHIMRQQASKEVKEAAENLAYWKRQSVIRQNKDAARHAAGLARAWQTTLAARQDRLDALSLH